MSAVYTREAFQAAYSEKFQSVLAYVDKNPGVTVDAIATALSGAYRPQKRSELR